MKQLSLNLFLLILVPFFLSAQEESRLMRFPSIYGDQIVFSYAGDLYTVAKSGGVARKLTTNKGYEMFARFSPDGKQIAFTGQYDGNTEVYVVPSQGGEPRRLTITATLNRDDLSDRMGPNNIVMAWKDNETLVYRSRMISFNDFVGQLFSVSVNGGLSTQLPLPAGGFCSYSPDKTKLAYNQVFREFRTWKYYKGGMADDIWIYDFNTKQTSNITNNPAQDIFPMWKGDKIYYCSDRDRIMNLFVYDTKTAQTRKLTNYTEYDIKFPSLGDNAIVYENGGYLYYFDLNTEKSVKVTVQIFNDFNQSRKELKDASKSIRSASVSPDGKRVVFGSRGEMFSVPAKKGITKTLIPSSGSHERNVEWSPDGKWIAFISDRSGEDEIYLLSQDGTGDPVQLTKNADTYKFRLQWSPDAKKILWSDKMQRLQYVDIDSKKVTVVDQSKVWEFTEFNWSPDNQWIVYTRAEEDGVPKIFIYNMETGKIQPVTNIWYASGSPVFSPDGKYLYFTSQRTFNPDYSWTEWNHSYDDMTKVYLITLAKDTKSPFAPENDEVTITDKEDPAKAGTSDKKDEKKDKGEAEKDKKVTVKIDFDGISDRVAEVSSQPGAYWGLAPTNDGIYYTFNSGDARTPSLKYFDLKTKKETELGMAGGYEISADGKKMLISQSGKWAVIDLPKSKLNIEDWMDLSGMKVMVDLKAEWQQIYTESWRQMKYFFYDPGMHGVNWDQMKEKYNVLVPYINNRYDLSYIIGELIGELSVGHAYVGDGDRVIPEKIKLGLLGATINRDGSGYYRIDKILAGQNWDKSVRSPLTEAGVDVKEGDFIIAVNGNSTKNMNDLYESLIGKANTPVELTVNSSPDGNSAKKVIVIPIDDESQLYYYNWVQNNIKKVNEATNGEVGYIHIPNMGVEGLNEFVKYYYPQLRKKALIIDDRGNGGGNVSPMIIERLRRELTHMAMSRNSIQSTVPESMILGPKVCLINQYSASDGDLFPYQFRQMKLGKLIGTRTWGGVVGIRGSLPFVDGGSLMRPEFAHYNAQGTDWIIEGHGVEPDIEIRNDPAREFAGIDDQLNKAIEVILDELKTQKKDLPPIPEFPDKTK